MAKVTMTSALTEDKIELKIEEFLGNGSFGKVYICRTPFAECSKYALKEINISAKNRTRVLHEVEMLNKIYSSSNCQEFLL